MGPVLHAPDGRQASEQAFWKAPLGPPRLPPICRSSAVSVGGLTSVDVVAPCLLLGFALSNGPQPQGAQRGAEQQSMTTRLRVDAGELSTPAQVQFPAKPRRHRSSAHAKIRWLSRIEFGYRGPSPSSPSHPSPSAATHPNSQAEPDPHIQQKSHIWAARPVGQRRRLPAGQVVRSLGPDIGIRDG
jgi:hypothetical protein